MVERFGKKGSNLTRLKAQYDEWRETWCNPILGEIYLGRIEHARKLLIAARDDLEANKLPEDVKEALSFKMVYVTCRLEWGELESGYSKENYEAIISQLSIPADTEFGDYTRRAYLLTFRCHGTADSFDELTKDDVEELLEPLPEEIAETSWQQVARWAFEQREPDILERAFEVALVHPSNYMGQAKWQRINIMYQLLLGRATRRDIVETIKTFEVRPQVVEFNLIIWPECVKAGITDMELEKMRDDKEAEIMALESAPGLERKTKSFLGRN